MSAIKPRSIVIDTRLEYALYALAVKAPLDLYDAEHFGGGMRVNDRAAAEWARRLAGEFAGEQERS